MNESENLWYWLLTNASTNRELTKRPDMTILVCSEQFLRFPIECMFFFYVLHFDIQKHKFSAWYWEPINIKGWFIGSFYALT